MAGRPRLVVFSSNAAVLVDEFRRGGLFVTLPNNQGVAGAVRVVGNLKPDIVVLDLEDENDPALGAVERITWNAPYATVVVLSQAVGLSWVTGLMQAGADGFVAKPYNLMALPQYVDDLHGKVQARKRHWSEQKLELLNPRCPRLITVFSPKGGVGKTTISVNLAVALRQITEKAVLLMDVDVEAGDTAVMLDLKPKRSLLEYARAVSSEEDVSLEPYLTSHPCGIELLAAPPSPEHAEMVKGAHVRKAIDMARLSADYVVADTAPTFSEQVLAVLDSADTILLPVTPDITALKNVRLALDVMADLRYPREKLFVVMNRAVDNLGLTPAQLAEVLGCPVEAQVPNDPQVVTAAMNEGRPFVLVHPDAPISRAVVEIAGRLSGGVSSESPAQQRAGLRRSFWQRLFGWK